jgi:hypothetical protein
MPEMSRCSEKYPKEMLLEFIESMRKAVATGETKFDKSPDIRDYEVSEEV